MSKTDFTTLTIERLREVLDYCPETGLFTWRVSTGRRMPVGSAAGSLKPNGYVTVKLDRKLHKAHRLAFFWVTGEASKAQAIDHIDRNPSNNRFSNLREASRSENLQNSKLNEANSSGHKGVSWRIRSQKWVASLGLQGKTLNLGSFSNIEDAIAARKAAEIIHHPFRIITPPAAPL